MAVQITNENFETLISGAQPVVIDFWAEWCGPCRTISPIIEELAMEYDGRIIVGKCDVEDNDDIVSRFGIRNIPTIIMLKGGEIVDKHVGAASKDALKAKLEMLL
ncbi:MAG: thioredoxin [Rikenellaceae bacterium]